MVAALVMGVIIAGVTASGVSLASVFGGAGQSVATATASGTPVATSPGPGIPPVPDGMTCQDNGMGPDGIGGIIYDRQCFYPSGMIYAAGSYSVDPPAYAGGTPIISGQMDYSFSGGPTQTQFYQSASFPQPAAGVTTTSLTPSGQASFYSTEFGVPCATESASAGLGNSQLAAVFGFASMPAGYLPPSGGGFETCAPGA